MKLTRTINKQEGLSILPCPSCKSDSSMTIGSCGYTTFNPGFAKCGFCNIDWDLGFVGDNWDAGVKWNKLCLSINHKLQLLDLLQVESKTSISRDFAIEDKEEEARVFKEEIRSLIMTGKL